VRDGFLRDFEPAVYSLPVNYRATKMLIGAADSFAHRAYARRCTRLVPAPSCLPGTPVVITQEEDEEAEGTWIGAQILKHQAASKCRFRNIAVLCRSNQKADELGHILADMAVPCITADQYNFFRRQEIKDVMAFLRVLLNPYDISAAQRIVLRYVAGVGEVGVRHIMEEGSAVGLRLSDFLREETYMHNDPFGPLLHAWESGRVLVLDTETTGLSTFEEDVIELAYVQLERGQITGECSSLLQSSKGVGDTLQIHHISDDMLEREGVAPAVAFENLFRRMPGALIVGHNVAYDLAMIHSQANRIGLQIPCFGVADTYEIAKRFVKSESYKLASLCAGLGVPAGTAHRALGDVQSTVGLLAYLIPELKKDTANRRALVAGFRDKFLDMAVSLAKLKDTASVKRPPQLLLEIFDTLGLMKKFEAEPIRHANLKHLLTLFEEHDSPSRHPLESLQAIVQFASLAKHLDQLSEKDDKVVVVPIHQSKGLEFDVVFIAGAVDGAMPHVYATDREEEKRLFYVAMTRPKVALYISGYRTKITSDGLPIKKNMTPYVQKIAKAFVEDRQGQGEVGKSRMIKPVEAAQSHPIESSVIFVKFREILLRMRRYTATWLGWR
jgi:DNA helicase-2/ATP-dependent DNA helicase PcrA